MSQEESALVLLRRARVADLSEEVRRLRHACTHAVGVLRRVANDGEAAKATREAAWAAALDLEMAARPADGCKP
jgi:hypothetical protein